MLTLIDVIYNCFELIERLLQKAAIELQGMLLFIMLVGSIFWIFVALYRHEMSDLMNGAFWTLVSMVTTITVCSLDDQSNLTANVFDWPFET
jgi:hypothetical protein